MCQGASVEGLFADVELQIEIVNTCFWNNGLNTSWLQKVTDAMEGKVVDVKTLHLESCF